MRLAALVAMERHRIFLVFLFFMLAVVAAVELFCPPHLEDLVVAELALAAIPKQLRQRPAPQTVAVVAVVVRQTTVTAPPAVPAS